MLQNPKSWSEARRMAADALAEMSDQEDAAIMADAQSDHDSPPADDLGHRVIQAATPRSKVSVSLRLDQDIVDRLLAGGPGWQKRANLLLRKGVGLN